MFGGLLALLSAATFAFSNVSARRAVLTGSVVQGLAITVPIGVPLFLVATFAAGSLGAIAGFSSFTVLFLCLAGILHFVAGRYCNYRAINALGGNLSALVQQTSLLFSLGLAIAFLGESLTPLRLFGIVLVVTGPAMMLRRRGPGVATPGSFSPRYAEGYVFSLLSAVAYGVSPVLVRAAVWDVDLSASLAGGLVSYGAATVVLAPLLLRPATWRHVRSMETETGRWFTVAGVFVCASQMMRYMALALVPVTVVTPLHRTAIVFRILFGRVLNRDHEMFGWRMVVGILISLVGALALTLTTELVVSLIPLPDALIEAAKWRWPMR